jgi:HEAT repeat protein
LVAALVLLAGIAFIPYPVHADEQDAAKDAGPRVKKEDFRYDGKPFSYWQSYLLTELKAERRIDAIWAMGAFGSKGYAPEATKVLVETVKEFAAERVVYDPEPGTPDQKVMTAIHQAIVKIGPDAAVVLLKNLDDKRVQAWCENIYGNQSLGGRIPTSSVPVLIEKMLVRETRRTAIGILGKSLNDKQIAEAFAAATKDKKTANAIATALAQIPEDYSYFSSEVVPILEILGPQARPALFLLVEASVGEEKDATVSSAKRTLAKIKPTPAEVLPGLIKNMWNESFRADIAKRIIEIGKPAIPALLEAANGPLVDGGWDYSKARLAQIDALVELGADKKDVLGAIRKILKSAESAALRQPASLRQEAIKRLIRLEDNPEKIVALLTTELQRPLDSNIILVNGLVPETGKPFHQEVIIALGKQGSKAKSAVPVLLKTYENEEEPTRLVILQTLGKIGPEAKAAIPFLNGLLQSENAQIRAAAARAIEAITQNKRE